jgi:ATP-dependent exoDNAse (exonuclease V) alpha subunit
VDTVLVADAANRAATNHNQWYVAISRGRKNVVVFTSDKEELRANVQRSGDRKLALDLKDTASVPAEFTRQQVRQFPAWAHRAWQTIQRLQRQQFIEKTNLRMHPAPRVQQRFVENHQPRVQSAPQIRIKL